MSGRDVLRFALATARLLGPVFPCAPCAKEPYGKLAPRGCYSATRDPEVIRSWFRVGRVSTLNLALALGAGLFALDVDPRNGGDEGLAELERQHGALPDTVRAVTGGGGAHYLFRHDTAHVLGNGAIASGVDVKAAGGYILIAPSIHPSGNPYRWDLGALPSETPIAPAPAWLLDLAAKNVAKSYGPATGPAAESFVGRAFASAGLLGTIVSKRTGAVAVCCPWCGLHSDGRGQGDDLSSAILPPTATAKLGAFRCQHSHCTGRRTGEALAELPAAAIEAAAAACPAVAGIAVRWLEEREVAA